MKISKQIGWVLCALSLAASVCANATANPSEAPQETQQKNPLQFKLRSYEGREWTDADFNDKSLVVVAFLGTECPLVKLYGPKLQSLSEEFNKDVAFIGVNSNTQDSVTEMSAYAERHGVRFPMLKDVGNKLADRFKAERTPEVFLLDAKRTVRYHGRIDDQYGIGIIRDKAERNDLRIAIEELLAGKDVAIPETEVVGCHIGRVKVTEPIGEITYTKDIAPIFNRRCVECHRDGELAPFTLTSYDDIIGWEDTICEVIEENRMPPWFANPEHGKFKNDCRLSETEKETVYQWVENGMPEGDPADLPEPPKFAQGWRIPKPDQVFYMSEKPFKVKAQGTIDYKHFYVDPNWTEDKYISAAEARPDNKSVVHHILVYVIPPDGRGRGGLGNVLVGYAPGSTPVMLEEGVAIKVPAGSKLEFEMHYTPNGYEEEDRSYAGVKFVDKKDVDTLIQGRVAINDGIVIPPHAENHLQYSEYTVQRYSELLVSMTPHMHLRGKSFKYVAHYPDGQQEVLLDVPNYDFNWQLKYILDEPKLLPKGTVIKCTAAFDNSEHNPVNPDPDKTVRWGKQSWEEMLIGFFDTLPAQDETTAVARKSKPNRDPTGTYAWGGPFAGTLQLAMQDDILTGKLESRGNTFDIEEAVILGDDLTFNVAVRRGMFLSFEAKLEEDAIRGKLNFTVEAAGRGGEMPWTAEKQAESAASSQ